MKALLHDPGDAMLAPVSAAWAVVLSQPVQWLNCRSKSCSPAIAQAEIDPSISSTDWCERHATLLPQLYTQPGQRTARAYEPACAQS